MKNQYNSVRSTDRKND